MDKLKTRVLKLWRVHKEKITYVFFGGLTTLVYYLVYFPMMWATKESVALSTNTAWLAGVLFAFVTNKLWVFNSKATGLEFWREFATFVAARAFSGLLNWAIMEAGVTWLQLWHVPVSLFAQVLVVVMNYFFSKWFIFKKEKKTEEMDTMDATQNKTIYDLLHRRSYRAFQPMALQQAEVETIVECALHAPSARNEQPWHVTVIRNAQTIKDISGAMADVLRASGDAGAIARADDPNFCSFHHAPCVVLLSGPADSRFRVSDCGGMAQTIAVAAQAMGIGSVIVASMMPVFDGPAADEFMTRLQIPEGYKPTLSVALGYPACEEPNAPERKADTVTYID